MSKVFKIHLPIPPNWAFIAKTCDYIDELLSFYFEDIDMLSRANVISNELVENIVKYSDKSSELIPSIYLEWSEDQKHIRICTENPVSTSSEHNEKQVQKVLDRLNGVEDAMDAYVDRMNERERTPDGHSRLGLLRIAAEGYCSLKANLDDRSVLCIEADMPIVAPF